MYDAVFFCVEVEDFKSCHIDGILICISSGKLVAGPFFGKVDVFRAVKPQTVIIVRASDAEGWRFNDVVGTVVDDFLFAHIAPHITIIALCCANVNI